MGAAMTPQQIRLLFLAAASLKCDCLQGCRCAATARQAIDDALKLGGVTIVASATFSLN
jgi:hypothetical protein